MGTPESYSDRHGDLEQWSSRNRSTRLFFMPLEAKINNVSPRYTCARGIWMFFFPLVDIFAMWKDSGECCHFLLWIWQHEVFPIFLWNRSIRPKSIMKWMLQPKGKRKELKHQVVTNWNNILYQLVRAVAFFCQSAWAHLENKTRWLSTVNEAMIQFP